MSAVKLPRIETGGLVSQTMASGSSSTSSSSSMTSSDATSPRTSQPALTQRQRTKLHVAGLANELVTQLLINQPENVALFCAEYLESKLAARNREKEKMIKLKRRKYAKKKDGGSSAGSMLQATGRYDPATTMEGVASGMQDFDPLKEQVRLPDSGSCWIPAAVAGKAAAQAAFNSPHTPCRSVLAGHKDAVTQSCILDSYVITASLDQTIRVWELSSGKSIKAFSCNQPVHSFVCVRVPGTLTRALLLAGCNNGRVPAWVLNLDGSTVTGNCTNVLSCHLPNPIRAMAVSPNRRHMVTGCCFLMNQICLNRTRQISVRGTLKTWDFDKMMECAIEPKDGDQNMTHKAMRTMKQLAAAVITRKKSYSRNAREFDEEKFFGIRTIAYTPDSAKVVVGFGHPDDIAEKDVKLTVVCCAETLTTLWADQNEQFQVNSVGFSNHGLGTPWMPWHLVVSSQGQLNKLTVYTKDIAARGAESVRVRHVWQQSFPGTDNFHGGISPDGAFVATACDDVLCLWNAEDGGKIAEYEGHDERIVHVCFSPDGQSISSCSEDGTCRIWCVPTRDFYYPPVKA